jgi:hypothetical protein
MSHKSAKKVRRLLKATGQASTPTANAWQEREYMEDTAKRKKQLVELKTGEEKEIEVSMGQVTLKQGSGRAIYKLVKKVMSGQKVMPKRAPPSAPEIREIEVTP